MATNNPEDLNVDLHKVEDKYFLDLSNYSDDPTYYNDYNFKKTDVAREGRSSQIYNKKTLARLVGGCIVLNKTYDKVLMISSSKHKSKWVFPKGGIELDELKNFKLTARRETWEEAGVVGKILRKLPVVEDHRFQKPAKKESSTSSSSSSSSVDLRNEDGVKIPRSEFHFYEMEITELCDKWPEGGSRERKWCSYEEAKHELHKSNRPELLSSLNSSRIKKNRVVVKIDEHSNHIQDAQPQTDNY
ncbi:unnamed protein product [Ambrosiozyma monospora]|uniref:Unnamed protein product n=1 Tax=Ambrosiozyma monospora TaxID=43982 RepID=A0ACB5SXF5_AMBMO|nr:unnamed protein product [Ambrosiozyma monospora]